MGELKLCPFCGEALVRYEPRREGDSWFQHPTNDCVLAVVGMGDSFVIFESNNEIEKWNRRADAPSPLPNGAPGATDAEKAAPEQVLSDEEAARIAFEQDAKLIQGGAYADVDLRGTRTPTGYMNPSWSEDWRLWKRAWDAALGSPPSQVPLVEQITEENRQGEAGASGVKTCRAIEDCPHPQECGKAGGCGRNDQARNAGVEGRKP